MAKWIQWLIISGILISWLFLVYLIDFDADGSRIFLFEVAVLSATPYFLLWLSARFLVRERALKVLLFTSLSLTGSSAFLAVSVLTSTGSTSGLAVLFVPIYQVVGVLVLIGIAFIAGRRDGTDA